MSNPTPVRLNRALIRAAAPDRVAMRAMAIVALALIAPAPAADAPPPSNSLVLTSSSAYLADGFAWAKSTALGKVHPDNGGCYQASMTDRGG